MDRRDFLRSAIATAGGVLTGSTVNEADGPRKREIPEAIAETDAQRECDSCRKLRKAQQEYLHQMLLPKEAAAIAEMRLPPERHDWTDDCIYRSLQEECDANWTREDFEDMEYDLDSTVQGHRISTSLNFTPSTDEVQATVTVGDLGDSE